MSPAAADDADQGTDLCGKSVAYKADAESFGDDRTALATARMVRAFSPPRAHSREAAARIRFSSSGSG